MKARPAIPLDAGIIYVIVNEMNGRRYVGHTSQFMHVRWAAHRTMLRKGRHWNTLFQRDWTQDGPDAFSVEAIALVGDFQARGAEEALTLRYFEAGIPLYNKVAGARPFPAKRVDLKTLNAICKALDVQPGDILEYVPDTEIADAGD